MYNGSSSRNKLTNRKKNMTIISMAIDEDCNQVQVGDEPEAIQYWLTRKLTNTEVIELKTKFPYGVYYTEENGRHVDPTIDADCEYFGDVYEFLGKLNTDEV